MAADLSTAFHCFLVTFWPAQNLLFIVFFVFKELSFWFDLIYLFYLFDWTVVRFIGRRAGSASVPVVLQRVAFDFVHFFIFAFTPLSGLLLPARVYCLRRWPSTRSSSGFTPARYFFLFFVRHFHWGRRFIRFLHLLSSIFFPPDAELCCYCHPRLVMNLKKKGNKYTTKRQKTHL